MAQTESDQLRSSIVRMLKEMSNETQLKRDLVDCTLEKRIKEQCNVLAKGQSYLNSVSSTARKL